ncbi:ABC transporter [Chromatiales bacterium (ex Bugula neritina AB1)]|nr:ABC transporter [Chromatiales bacterium (ex Bugula neritina AB1)]
MNALEITALSKTYSNGQQALRGIDLSVEEGDFFALLGPNGAGKSTAIGIISSLVSDSSGTVKVFGHDLKTDRNRCKMHIGLVPQEINFNIFEDPLNIVVTQAGYYGISRKVAMQRAEKYLKLLHLWDKRSGPARQLSGGMKRRLMIARALVHEPRLLILDEPTAGVDIEIRRSMWDLLKQINDDGTTIILTTHYLEEAETLCRNVAIIDDGKIVEQGEVDELLSRAMTQSFVLDLKEPIATEPHLDGFVVITAIQQRLEVEVRVGDNMNGLFQQLQTQGIEVISMRNKANRLEEFFLRLVGEKNSATSRTEVAG